MDLNWSEEQDLLRKNARAYLAEASPLTTVRAIEDSGAMMSRELWQAFAGLGWLGLGLPADIGGLGGDAQDLAVLAEELGRSLAPVPWLSTVVLAGQILSAARGPLADRVLSDIVEGRSVVALAIREADLGYGPDAIQLRATSTSPAGNQPAPLLLTGEKRFVVDGAVADRLLVVARSQGSGADGITLALVDADDPGVTVLPQPNTAGDGLANVRFENARAELVGPVGQGWDILTAPTRLATALLCGWMIAGAERGFEMAVEYAKTRVQFGRPIGSFQAVSHKLADVKLRLDQSRMLTQRAIAELTAGEPAVAEVAMAKQWTNAGVRFAMFRLHETFAGIGFMKIHDLQLFYRRLKAAESWLGDETFHRREVVRERILV